MLQDLGFVSVPVACLLALVVTCVAREAGAQGPQASAGESAQTVNMAKIKTLDCTGAYVCRQGTRLFVTGDGQGYSLDIRGDPSEPVVLCNALPHAWDIAIKDNYAYVADYTPLLTVYDMGDGKSWRKVSTCETPGMTENIIIRGDLAYIANHTDRLQIIDIHDAEHPAVVGENKIEKQDIDAIALEGDVAYLYDHWHGTLRLVDVADPADSKHLSLFKSGHPFVQGEMDLCDGYAYCVAGEKGLVIADVRDKTAPKKAAVLDTPGHAMDVIVSDGFAFVADMGGGVRVADVHDPTNPVEVGSYRSKDLIAHQLAVLGNTVYVACKPPQPLTILRFTPPEKE